MQEHELDRLFHALSDSTRRTILMSVRDQDLSVNEIASQFDISLPAVSKHLRTLEQAGLLSRRKLGRQRICHAEPALMTAATEWLEYYQSFWDDRLESLKSYVENET